MPKNESFLSKALGRFGLELTGGKREKRSSLENPQTPLSYPAEWLLDIFNGGRTDAGLRVSEMTALSVSTVFQCVNIISNGIATHPLNVYERVMADNRSGKKIAYDHPLFSFLHSQPNEEMTSISWRKVMQVHALLWGNGYSEIQRDGANRIIGIWPRNPARTRPVRLTEQAVIEGTVYPPGTLVYETYESLVDSQIMEQDSLNTYDGTRRIILAEDMLHIPGLSLDGRIGQDVVNISRQVFGLALATEKYGAKFFGNGAIPSGMLTIPGDMDDVQMEVLKRSWAEAHGGENTHKTGLLPPGVTYNKTGATPEEGQMLQTRQHQKAEIASVFNVPGHMVGVSGDDAGKSSIEQSSIEFKLFCLDPWGVTWEQELDRKLFSKVGRTAGKFFAGFDFRKLLYPDAESRSALYSSGKQWGYLTTNDIRELEGMNPVEDVGDRLWMPNNMVDADQTAAHSDAVQTGLKNKTLAATPAGTTPVGNHPVVQDKMKVAKMTAKARADASAQALANNSNNAQAKLDKNQNPSSTAKKAPAKQKRAEAIAALGVLYRDAVGRAAHRSKATVEDYRTIFAPVTNAAATIMFGETVDVIEFINGYTKDLFTRAAKWPADNLDEVASEEFEALLDLLEIA